MTVYTIEVGPVAVQLIADADSIVATERRGEPFEPETLAEWARICADGGAVLDVGAHTGLFSIAAAKLGCKVIAFEPMPRNVDRLCQNAILNEVKIDVRAVAATDHDGTVEFFYNPLVPHLTSGASLLYPSGGREKRKITVPAVTIDSLALAECKAIKIDVERSEPLVLAGARETIARCRPSLIVEVLDERRGREVAAAAPGYRVERRMDVRNWLMQPC